MTIYSSHVSNLCTRNFWQHFFFRTNSREQFWKYILFYSQKNKNIWFSIQKFLNCNISGPGSCIIPYRSYVIVSCNTMWWSVILELQLIPIGFHIYMYIPAFIVFRLFLSGCFKIIDQNELWKWKFDWIDYCFF